MSKIIATMATYPGRSPLVEESVASMAGQVDTLNLVLNEYHSIPEWVSTYPSINAIIPEEDTKDTGKYLVPVAENDWLFTIDDDIAYPPDYVKISLDSFQRLGGSRMIAGYHGGTYRKPRYLPSHRRVRKLLGFDPNYIVTCKSMFYFSDGLDRHYVVDELGTGTTFSRGADVPPFSIVQTAQRFVDIRLAQWSHQTGRKMVCLSRPPQWLKPIRISDATSIFYSFTMKRPELVAREIETFAFQNKGAGLPL